jgi:hypothetical protein
MVRKQAVWRDRLQRGVVRSFTVFWSFYRPITRDISIRPSEIGWRNGFQRRSFIPHGGYGFNGQERQF